MKNNLYTYNFIGGGFNQEYATNITQAKAQAITKYPTLGIDLNSFKLVKDEEAYYNSFPLMD
jgi:hypothetical protein